MILVWRKTFFSPCFRNESNFEFFEWTQTAIKLQRGIFRSRNLLDFNFIYTRLPKERWIKDETLMERRRDDVFFTSLYSGKSFPKKLHLRFWSNFLPRLKRLGTSFSAYFQTFMRRKFLKNSRKRRGIIFRYEVACIFRMVSKVFYKSRNFSFGSSQNIDIVILLEAKMINNIDTIFRAKQRNCEYERPIFQTNDLEWIIIQSKSPNLLLYATQLTNLEISCTKLFSKIDKKREIVKYWFVTA